MSILQLIQKILCPVVVAGIVTEIEIVAARTDNEQANEIELNNLRNKVHKRQPYIILTKWAPLDESLGIRTITEINLLSPQPYHKCHINLESRCSSFIQKSTSTA